MKVGGASGPLYGTLFMTLGKSLPDAPDRDGRRRGACRRRSTRSRRAASRMSARRPCSTCWCPVQEALAGGADPRRRRRARARAAEATIPMKATRGRASFLGDRSIGHMDPGARSSALIVEAVAEVARGGAHEGNVGIVIVSHSPLVAEGTADMVRQMVGDEVPLAFCGGNPEGGLGTSVEAILKAIDSAWSEAGVAILVDLGGAETNSEMAVEMLPEERAGRVVVCNAPIVEGAVIAATEASGGASLEVVKRTAEELSPA